jgi:hypothetical protein
LVAAEQVVQTNQEEEHREHRKGLMEVVRHKHWPVEEVAEPRKNTVVAYYKAPRRRLVEQLAGLKTGSSELLHKAMKPRWSVPPAMSRLVGSLEFPDCPFWHHNSCKTLLPLEA